MDINEYAMEHLVRDRLATLRAAAARQTLPPPAASPSRARVWLGGALIHAGHWLRAGATDRRHAPPMRG